MARRRGRRARLGRSAPSRIFQRAVPPKRWIQRRAADATLRLPGRNSVAVRRNAAPEANSNANAYARTRTQRLLTRLASGLLVAHASRTRSQARKAASRTVHSHPSIASNAIRLAMLPKANRISQRSRARTSRTRHGGRGPGMESDHAVRPASAGRLLVAAAALGPGMG